MAQSTADILAAISILLSDFTDFIEDGTRCHRCKTIPAVRITAISRRASATACLRYPEDPKPPSVVNGDMWVVSGWQTINQDWVKVGSPFGDSERWYCPECSGRIMQVLDLAEAEAQP